MMRTKKYKNNEYVLTPSGIWVRDLTQGHFPVDINHLTSEKDYQLFIDNEMYIKSLNLMYLEDEKKKYKNIIIVSDGYDFQNRQVLLKEIKQKHIVIGINKSLKKWNTKLGRMDYYIVNNPYKECINYLPSVRYFPTCIAATRTNKEFIKRYKGDLRKYIATVSESFSSSDKKSFRIDDYRNPLCAALHIAYFLGGEKILLYCCDDSFKEDRPGAELLSNGLYSYPQHKIQHEIIDQMAAFIKIADNFIEIKDFSSGYEYNNIDLISSENLPNIFE